MNTDKLVKTLKKGQVALFHVDGRVYKFQNIYDAYNNAVEHGRTQAHGWDIVDDSGMSYGSNNWEALVGYKYVKMRAYMEGYYKALQDMEDYLNTYAIADRMTKMVLDMYAWIEKRRND